MQPEVHSPYMMWQYMHALKPQKPTDYLLHPAFARPANSFTNQQSGCTTEQVVGGYGYCYHQPSQQTIHPDPYLYSKHTDAGPTNPSFANDFNHCKNNLKKCTNNKCRTERHTKSISNSTKHLPKVQGLTDLGSFSQYPRSVSPLKGSSFTIDAILKKDDKIRTQNDYGLALDEAVLTSQVKPGLSYTPERSGSASPICLASCSPGRLYGPPLMHSTPSEQEKKKGRFYEFVQPYLFHQYEPVQSQHQQPHHHLHAQTLGPSQLAATSLSSLSSLSSVSSTSPVSTESNQILQKGKLERKSGGKPKRIRTIFTPEQLEKLEAEFERQQYMVGTERYYLAAALNLTEAQVKVWFQNRRIKWRKQHLEQQQARLAQGDLFRDVDNEDDDESDILDSEDRMDEFSTDLSDKNHVLEKTVISDETGYCSS